MDDTSRVVAYPHSGISSEQARDIRARAWAYVFECFARHKREAGTGTNYGEDAKFATEVRRPAV